MYSCCYDIILIYSISTQLKKHMCSNETIIEIQKLVYTDIMFVSTSKSTKIHFYYTFCFLITVVYFSSIVYNVSIAEEDLDEGKHSGVFFYLSLLDNTPN